MQQKNTIIIDITGSVGTITLNRPSVHNAMSILMIRELTEAIKEMGSKDGIRILHLASSGINFSAGADLNWMKEAMKQNPEQLKAESMEMANLFRIIWETGLIVLSSLQGKVMAGANGLVAACDIVVAEETATFSFPEVKLGLVPATIAPFVLRKLGYSRTAELMISGRVFSAKEALASGLIHFLCEEGSLKETTAGIIADLLSNGPEAMKGVKNLLQTLESAPSPDQEHRLTAEIIARHRISPEGQEGINAFFEKRKPGWHEAK